MGLVKPPTPEEFKNELINIRDHTHGDEEDIHINMDDYILDTLSSLGYQDGVRIFRTTPKWYA